MKGIKEIKTPEERKIGYLEYITRKHEPKENKPERFLSWDDLYVNGCKKEVK